MENRHIPTSLRLMPRAFTCDEVVNTWTEVFSNCRFRRRLLLKLFLSTIRAETSEVQGSVMTLAGEDYGGPVLPIQDLNSREPTRTLSSALSQEAAVSW